MDELQFRRQAYAEPNCQEDEFLLAMNDDPSLRDFVCDLKRLDNKIDQALKVEVAEDFVDKLLLKQQFNMTNKVKRQGRVFLAIAASLTFVIGVSFSMLRLAPVDVAENALAHVYNEERALISRDDISFETINRELSSVKVLPNISFKAQPGKILYSENCDFHGVRGLHLVMQGEQSKVTLFIIPQESRMSFKKRFVDDNYYGEALAQDDVYLVFVGEKPQDISAVKNSVKIALS